MMKTWQLGYRFPGKLGYHPYQTPYVNLPEFVASQLAAVTSHNDLLRDFPDVEWRLVEA